MRSLVQEVQSSFGNLSGRLVCDVGCNDGSLLSFFKQAGARTCGIEPTGAAADAQAAGHHVIQDYFSPKSAARLVAEVGKPDVITFTNVFAHIESLKEAIDAVKVLAGERTILVIENHYLGSVLAGNQFDTFYHEHPRTYSFRSFEFIAKSLGGEVLLATFPKRYGGNIRVCIGNMQGGKSHGKPAGADARGTNESNFAADLAKMQQFVEKWTVDTR
ncbi:MAG TPA: class I SAM-dependent methyltransferase, partial [Candidatus Angelobacter sp.]|nr:class I SAM-dependent methyltransferase [Candidatus Angelobacter sp.]